MTQTLLLLCAFIFVQSAYSQTEDSLSTSPIPEAVQAVDSTGAGMHVQSIINRDSLLSHNYHHIGDAISLIPGINLYSLGANIQPAWIGYFGSQQHNQSILRDGILVQDPITAVSRLDLVAMEDAEKIVVYPQHQAFWYGGNGSLLTAEVQTPSWDSPRPFTRLRHLFGPYEHLYTDVLFSLNTNEKDNLTASLTRQTYGTNSAGRFRNSQSERWDARFQYTTRLWDRLTVKLGDQYGDIFNQMNSGSLGWLRGDSLNFIYPDTSITYADTGFSPILANLVNPTILVKEFRNTVFAEAGYQWFESEAMATTARLSYSSGSRQYEDEGFSIISESNQADKRIIHKRSWNEFRVDANHNVSIGWAELELGGALASLNLEHDSAYYGKTSAVSSMLRGKLRFGVDAFRLTAFARLENTYGQNTYGLGATMETSPNDNLLIWTGASLSTRPYSLFETSYRGSMALGIPESIPDFEQSVVFEGGLRFMTSWQETELRAFYRRTSQSLYLTSQVYVADSLFSRLVPVYLTPDMSIQVSGASIISTFSYSVFNLVLRGTALFQTYDDRDFEMPLAPELHGSADFQLRAKQSIVSTLDIKAGGKLQYSASYYPTIYLPEQGVFVSPNPAIKSQSSVNDYTDYLSLDLYVYARIRDIATLHLVLYNALDTDYITTQFHPMPDRGLQIGVDWIFLD